MHHPQNNRYGIDSLSFHCGGGKPTTLPDYNGFGPEHRNRYSIPAEAKPMEVTANIPIGTVARKSVKVTRDMTVAHFHGNMPEVYGTPIMIYLMEVTAAEAVEKYLPEGWATVGTMVHVSHLAATPVGFTVTARAEVLSVEGKVITFAVEAHDGVETIGTGKHTRVAIQVEKFESRVKMKVNPTA